MYQEILKRKTILEGRKPYSLEVRKELKNAELLDLIYTLLHLDGSAIKKEQIRKILDGDFVSEGTTVSDHLSIQHYIETVAFMDNLLSLRSDLSLKVIEDMHDMAVGGEGQIWRKHNPVLYTFDYNPPHWQDIGSKMEELILWAYRADEQLANNKIMKAVLVHNKLIEIYPFEYNSESTARLVMYFILMTEGFPVFELRLSEEEYNGSIVEYLKTKKTDILYKAVERGVFNKLEVMLQMTAEDE